MNSREYEIITESKKLIKSENIEKKEEGLKKLIDLANEKNKYALYELALLYKEGKYVEKNIKKSCNLFIFSGELGNFKSFYEAGKIFLEMKEDETAKRFFLKAKYSPQAFYELGKMYSKRKTSDHKAFSYYYQASKLGCPEADYVLAESFILGKGVKVDLQKGVYYLQRSLRKGIKDKLELKELVYRYKEKRKTINSIN